MSFKLANSFDVDAPYTAYFSPESPSVFSVVPAAGVLPRQRSAEGARPTTNPHPDRNPNPNPNP